MQIFSAVTITSDTCHGFTLGATFCGGHGM